MSHRDLLFEIGCEELPPLQLRAALESLAAAWRAQAEAARVDHGQVRVYATPRRLALLIEGVAERQRDLEELVVGPPVQASFDADGAPTRAARGFADKLGVAVEDLERVEQTRRNKTATYVAATVREAGGEVAALLPELLAGLPGQVPWGKSMRWGYGEQVFARPVRWLVALFGAEVIGVRFAGVESGRRTRGHRFHHPGEVALERAGDYVARLREARVMVDLDARRATIEAQAREAAREAGGVLREDAALLDEVLHLVEWPVAVRGGFDASFLALPGGVLVTSMRKHQRYFAVQDAQGRALASFITISNTTPRDPAVVAAGNERVLRARLQDAEFFFAEDRKRRLEAYNEQLARMTYIEALGSVRDKVARVERLTRWLAEALGLDASAQVAAARAAHLCKADLATGMVYEFPELQGEIGGEYARLDGEPEAVWRGVAEHYAPRGAGDALPESASGALVSIADRIDSIVGLFALGNAPTGAADPYGLRRAALGLLRIHLDRGDRVALPALIEAAIAALPEAARPAQVAALAEEVHDFILTRLRYLLMETHPTEVIDGVLALGRDLEDLPGALGRVEALAAWHKTEEFAPLAITFKRAANILEEPAVMGDVDAALLEDDAERALHAETAAAAEAVGARIAARDFEGALARLVALRPPVDAFFEAVMVNAESAPLRANRHRLLRDVIHLFRRVADVRRL